ncbi:MAG TPA: acireductone synthase [Candidatus Xenobia bacterium]|jgi:2,3-diketo-5-methylthio-1-phosphopentane phosphatase
MPILLDIEGTTTPITFVYEVLFPYARQHLADFLRAGWSEAEVQSCAQAFAEQVQVDGMGVAVQGNPAQQRQAVLANALTYMDADRKVTCLKTLQGLVWRDGYQRGELQGVVYEDVPAALHRWAGQARPAYIFSSGSVEAQQLLMRHSTHGDLTSDLAGYFDTRIGSKREPDSYRRIAERMGAGPETITFATDVLDEAEAARQAGLQVVVMRRPGNPELPPHPFTEATDLLSL